MARLSDKIADIPPHKPPKVSIQTLSEEITCYLCKGYLIDATTIVECLHSFCHSCIMKHLRLEQFCPKCELMINKAKPNIKRDATLQAIVYKLVPGLYEKELLRRRAFYKLRPQDALLATPEQRGDDTEHLIFGPTEHISLSLEYAENEDCDEGTSYNNNNNINNNNNTNNNNNNNTTTKKVINDDVDDDVDNMDEELKRPKYLQCPAVFTVAHLKKFVLHKFGIDCNQFSVEIMYKVKTIVLPDHYTLMDVAYIYTWKRDAPMRFFYCVRTNEVATVEVPEIRLRRSPSVTTDRTKTTDVVSTTTPIVIEGTTLISDADIFLKPEVPSISNHNNNNMKNELLSSSSVAMSDKKLKLQSPLVVITVPKSPPKSTTTAESTTTTSAKHSTSKSDDKLSKTKSNKKIKDDLPSAPVEKRVENIKLKIEQTGVSIIKNTPSPPTSTKELKLKFKKEREQKEKNNLLIHQTSSNTNNPNNSSRKNKDIASIKIAKVPVENADSKNGYPQVKYEIKSPTPETSSTSISSILSPKSPKLIIKIEQHDSANAMQMLNKTASNKCDNENEKSKFLNGFNLTPTKSLSPEKLQQIDEQIKQKNQLSPSSRSEPKSSEITNSVKREIIAETIDNIEKSLKSPNKNGYNIAKTEKSPTSSSGTSSVTINTTTTISKSVTVGTSTTKSITSTLSTITKPTMSLKETITKQLTEKPKTVLQQLNEAKLKVLNAAEQQKAHFEKMTVKEKPPPPTTSKRKSKEPMKNVAKKYRPNSPVISNNKITSVGSIIANGRSELPSEMIKKSKTQTVLDKKLFNSDPVLSKLQPQKQPQPLVDTKSLPINKPDDSNNQSSKLPTTPPPKDIKLLTVDNCMQPGAHNALKDMMLKINHPPAKKLPLDPALLTDSSTQNLSLSVKPIDTLLAKKTCATNNNSNNIQRSTNKATGSGSKSQKQSNIPAPKKKLPTILPKPPGGLPINGQMKAALNGNNMNYHHQQQQQQPQQQQHSHQHQHPIQHHNNLDNETKSMKNDGNKSKKLIGSASPVYVPSFPNIQNKQTVVGGGSSGGTSGNVTPCNSGYLNYALMNSHKQRANEMPLGMRSPAYPMPQNSPSYSPNSPQYSPSYNIPTFPQYKYMKSPAQLANFFQGAAKPTAASSTTPPTNSNQMNSPQLPPPMSNNKDDLNKRKPISESLKRRLSISTDSTMPPEKQQKVQSLLDSCNISFPSSLSITLHEQNDPTSTNPLFNPMRKSPVNNYIEILKLPEIPAVTPLASSPSPSSSSLSASTTVSNSSLVCDDQKNKKHQSASSPRGAQEHTTKSTSVATIPSTNLLKQLTVTSTTTITPVVTSPVPVMSNKSMPIPYIVKQQQMPHPHQQQQLPQNASPPQTQQQQPQKPPPQSQMPTQQSLQQLQKQQQQQLHQQPQKQSAKPQQQQPSKPPQEQHLQPATIKRKTPPLLTLHSEKKSVTEITSLEKPKSPLSSVTLAKENVSFQAKFLQSLEEQERKRLAKLEKQPLPLPPVPISKSSTTLTVSPRPLVAATPNDGSKPKAAVPPVHHRRASINISPKSLSPPIARELPTTTTATTSTIPSLPPSSSLTTTTTSITASTPPTTTTTSSTPTSSAITSITKTTTTKPMDKSPKSSSSLAGNTITTTTTTTPTTTMTPTTPLTTTTIPTIIPPQNPSTANKTKLQQPKLESALDLTSPSQTSQAKVSGISTSPTIPSSGAVTTTLAKPLPNVPVHPQTSTPSSSSTTTNVTTPANIKKNEKKKLSLATTPPQPATPLPLLPITSSGQLAALSSAQQPMQPTPTDIALFDAIMARASQTTGLAYLQHHMQQQLYLANWARMQKAGTDQLNEFFESIKNGLKHDSAAQNSKDKEHKQVKSSSNSPSGGGSNNSSSSSSSSNNGSHTGSNNSTNPKNDGKSDGSKTVTKSSS